MGLLSWLFGSRPEAPRWQLSEKGNQTIVIGHYRATVFQQDGAWKYVIGDDDDRVKPVFSDRYATQREAMEAAMEEFG